MLVVFSAESTLAYLPLIIPLPYLDRVELTLDYAVSPKFGWRICQYLAPYGVAAVMAHESEVAVYACHVVFQPCKSLACSNHVYTAFQTLYGSVKDIGAFELDNRPYETNTLGVVL